jgi:hypothetical protein
VSRGGPVTFQPPWCRWVGRGILASRSSARLKQCRTIAIKSSFSFMPARADREANARTMTMTCGTATPKWSGASFARQLHRRAGPGFGRSPSELYSGQPRSDMQLRARRHWQRSSRCGTADTTNRHDPQDRTRHDGAASPTLNQFFADGGGYRK